MAGRNIRRIREERNLTQEMLADKVKIHVSTLGRIERGESNPPLKTLDRIAYALGVRANKLIP